MVDRQQKFYILLSFRNNILYNINILIFYIIILYNILYNEYNNILYNINSLITALHSVFIVRKRTNCKQIYVYTLFALGQFSLKSKFPLSFISPKFRDLVTV